MSVVLSAIPLVGQIIDKIFPNAADRDKAKLQLLEAQQRGELAALEADLQIMLAQTEVNKIEAASTDPFKSGWRPAVGWVCVSGMGFTYIIHPILGWLSMIQGFPAPPPIDTMDLMIMLGGMLGFGGMRTFERIKGYA